MQIRNLAVGAYAQGWTFWHYQHPGSCAVVMEHGFWRDAADMMRVGDFVAVSARDGTRLLVVADVDTQGVAMRVIWREERGMKIHPSVTIERVREAIERRMTTLDNPGFCVACGEEAMGCEPDAERYECEACGAKRVYGADALLMMLLFPWSGASASP